MNLINKFALKNININDLYFGEKLFLIGIFFLPSALPIGAFFLLSSIFIAFRNNNENLLKNKWNFIFLISTLLILLSTLYNYFFNLSPVLQNIDKSIILLNLFNCNYCNHSLIIEVEEHDYMDRMCMKCNRSFKSLVMR